MDKLLTPEEVCAMLRIKKQRLYEWVHYNRIPYMKAGRFLRFSKEQIEAWLRENTYGIIRGDEQQD